MSVVVADHDYEIDCLIFATSSEVGTSYRQRAGYEVIGREGRALSFALLREWRAAGTRKLVVTR